MTTRLLLTAVLAKAEKMQGLNKLKIAGVCGAYAAFGVGMFYVGKVIRLFMPLPGIPLTPASGCAAVVVYLLAVALHFDLPSQLWRRLRYGLPRRD